MAFLFAEIENRLSEDLPQADFGRVPERFLLSVRTKSKLRFCKLKTTPIVRFCYNSTHFFILSPSANALHNFLGSIVDPFISFVYKVDFSRQYCVYMTSKIEKLHIHARPCINL